jgi:hypothetical protein
MKVKRMFFFGLLKNSRNHILVKTAKASASSDSEVAIFSPASAVGIPDDPVVESFGGSAIADE